MTDDHPPRLHAPGPLDGPFDPLPDPWTAMTLAREMRIIAPRMRWERPQTIRTEGRSRLSIRGRWPGGRGKAAYVREEPDGSWVAGLIFFASQPALLPRPIVAPAPDVAWLRLREAVALAVDELGPMVEGMG